MLLGALRPFRLADIGEGISQVEVKEWYVKPGDKVEEMDRLCTVESDKAAVDITSSYGGVVKRLLFDVNTTAKVGDVLLEIEEEEEETTKEEVAPSDDDGVGAAVLNDTTRTASSGASTSSQNTRIVPFHLADIGEGISEVSVMEWYVKEGDHVEEMDRLCTVESDKAVVDITSRHRGTIRRLGCNAGDTAKVGSVLAEIEVEKSEEDEEEEGLGSVETEERVEKDDSSSSSSSGCSISAIPMVRQAAKENGIDINTLVGSGPDGRVTMEDVLKSTEKEKKVEEKFSEKNSENSTYRVSLLRGVAAAMVRSMTAALAAPHMNLGEEIRVDELVRVQANLKKLVQGPPYNLPSMTLTAMMMKALSLSLLKHEILNSKIEPSGEYYTVYGYHNISMAIDSPQGLVVPNVKNVEKKNLVEIQKDILELQARASSGRLTLEDIRGGTVSFSNVGVIGGTYSKAVLFDGQALIGGAGRIRTLPRFTDDGSEVYAAKVVNVSWSADHRHIDGATVARFSNTFKGYLENPASMILDAA
ncbi:dihydrolipoamide S-acetyltransferase, putative [Perkinsus marinus ATCC 50983]|uniref:Dihydrolipoamide acetyltransferase component of pyruvate dehydrogenase complex n=1 Tax=Perkinsus marinus (strain ATCC 50983 / TXsc) TaxID=423536 RepID=C5L430_PERM5|nr:dihydrolipoamide S-acetyltransferase, putative [Perkinsus marinus ATCC 50983]EER08496.1 dihydrolipoamide S-acetyltransferase, putative [Perkinsus marinus ATCC 50983]|eukprot:XP_002776680.1 dihydrolipoamide S-acetyltransferase, putative [Perkinsus marinus ATCC 50983]